MKSAPLRVGFLTSGWWPEAGGVQTVTGHLAAELMRRGQHVFALCFARAGFEAQHEGARAGTQRVRGVKVERVAALGRELRAAQDLVHKPDLEREVARWSVQEGLDIVHVHDIAGWGAGSLQRLAELGVPVFWTWHDYAALCPRGQMWHVENESCERAESSRCAPCVARTWPALAEDAQLESALELRLASALEVARVCKRIYCPSNAARDVFVRHGFLGESVTLCENGTAQVQLSARTSASSLRSNVHVGVLGSVQPSKGVLELAQWIHELGAPFELHVYGPRGDYHGDGSYVRALEQLAQRDARIQLHESFEHGERGELFAQLDLVAVPSLWQEVHGLVAREARRCGRAVFASDIGGLESRGLHLLPAGAGAAWKADLRRFATDAAWRRELESAVTPLCSIAEMADQLLRDYGAALAD